MVAVAVLVVVVKVVVVVVVVWSVVCRGTERISVCTSTRLRSLTAQTLVHGPMRQSRGVKLRRLLHQSK